MDTPRFTIGELARRTGLPVKTIRFYSDAGVVPESGRTAAGYRLYDTEALARLETARTLRDFGFDLGTVKGLLDRQVTFDDVVALHADALDTQIRLLRLRRAVLRAVAKRNSTPEEMELINRLAKLSADERNRIIGDFYDEVFGGLDIDPHFEQRMRSVTPDLPDDPTPAQVDAWIELAELVQEPGFRQRVREMAQSHSAARQAGEDMAATHPPAGFEQAVASTREGRWRPASTLRRRKRHPLSPPSSMPCAATPPTRPSCGPPPPNGSPWEATRRVERYWQLLGAINGWDAFPSMVPAFEWTVAALRAHPQPGAKMAP